MLAVRRMRTLVELGRSGGRRPHPGDRPLRSRWRCWRATTRIIRQPPSTASNHRTAWRTRRWPASGEVFDPTSAAAVVGACLAAGESQHVVAEAAGVSGWHGFPIGGVEPGAVSHVLVVATGPAAAVGRRAGAYLGLVTATIAAALGSQEELLAERRQVSWLAALDAAKSAFFAGVSHELRTPLALISAPVQDVLERERGLGAESREALGLVQANVARLDAHGRGHARLRRMEAGRLVPNLVPVDVSVVDRLRWQAASPPAFERAGLEFAVEIRQLSRSRVAGPGPVRADRFEPAHQRVEVHPGRSGATAPDRGGAGVPDPRSPTPAWGSTPPTRSGCSPASSGWPPGRAPGRRPGPGSVWRWCATSSDSSVVRSPWTSSPGEGSTFTVRLPFVPARADGRDR